MESLLYWKCYNFKFFIMIFLKEEEKSSSYSKKGIYTLKDLAKMFQVTIRTIYNWLDDNRFSFIKIGSKTYITEQQLQEFLSKHEVKSHKMGRVW